MGKQVLKSIWVVLFLLHKIKYTVFSKFHVKLSNTAIQKHASGLLPLMIAKLKETLHMLQSPINSVLKILHATQEQSFKNKRHFLPLKTRQLLRKIMYAPAIHWRYTL